MDRIGPYRVEDRLGAGGMGEVYRAFDDRLERWVAIKRIRADKEQTEDHRSRFRREARAAAKLNHPAIVHIYDIFQDGDSDCIVMELVEGRSLDVLLADGPLDPERAAQLGRQVAQGLAEAHGKGILHRDLKSENVIVTDDEQSKILDFGLAKPMVQGDLDASLTGQGQVVGTSRAMSPEYVGGDEVDHRADLFSLGVLLYEMVTGQSPFRAHNTLATLKRVILHQQAPARELNAEVSDEFSALIDQLLEKEPDDRPPSAAAVGDALGAFTGPGSTTTVNRPTWSTGVTRTQSLSGLRGPAPLWRRPALVVPVVAAVIALVAYFGWWRNRPANFTFAQNDLVLVGDFVNMTGEEILDESLNVAFRTGLATSFVNQLSDQQVDETLARMALEPDTTIDREKGIEIALRDSAKALILGTIVKVGTTYSITGEVINPLDGRSVLTKNETADHLDNIIGALGSVVQGIRANLGESLATIEEPGQQLARVTTRNLEALKAYSKGVSSLNAGHDEDTIVHLERAIELDPEFAMAHAMLGTAYRNLSRDLDKATASYDLALQNTDRLSEEEELYVEAWIATWHKTPAEMVDAWGRMATLLPDNFEAVHNLGMVHWQHLNQLDEAAAAISRARDLARTDHETLVATFHLGFIQLAQNRFDVASGTFKVAQPEPARIGLATVALARGELDQAGALAPSEDLDSRPLTDPDFRFIQTLLAILRGDYQTALARVEAAVHDARQASDLDLWASNEVARLALLALGETPAETLANPLRASISEARSLLTKKPAELGFAPAMLLAMIGKVAIRNQQEELAEEIRGVLEGLPQLSEFPLWKAYAEMLDAELRAAAGDPSGAAEALGLILNEVDLFSIRESLAYSLLESGDFQRAIEQYEELASRRGQALAECRETCLSRAMNALAISTASFQLGRAQEALGQPEAESSYTEFLERWGRTDLPIVRAAKESLDQWKPQGQPSTGH